MIEIFISITVPAERMNELKSLADHKHQAPAQNIYIRGIDRDSLYSSEQVVEMINEQIRNGGG